VLKKRMCVEIVEKIKHPWLGKGGLSAWLNRAPLTENVLSEPASLNVKT
jgi:hypothetical protein